MNSEYRGSFVGRKSCYTHLDFPVKCGTCGEKFFASYYQIRGCLRLCKDIPSEAKGVHVMCPHCGQTSERVLTPDLIEEFKNKSKIKGE